jgi:ATP-binding cassette subfamily F protein uup
MVIEAAGVTKRYGERAIIRDFSLRIQRGDRIGLVGPNGAGKTTLLRLLTGEFGPDSGKVTLAKTLSGIVIDQQRKLMDPAKRVRDILAHGGDWITVRGHKKHIKGYLKEFLFDPGLSDAPVGSLSGGERSRLLLAREFAREANLLVLDEPTNDLDLETLDLLQEVIADYEGTVLIVSHDRDFLDRTVTVTLGLDGSGKVDIVAGGYEDWVRKRYEAARHSKNPPRNGEVAAGRRSRTAAGGADPSTTRSSAGGAPPRSGEERRKLTYKDQHDYDRLPGEIERLEAAVAADEQALSDPDLYSRDAQRFAELTARLARHRADIDAAEMRWLEVAEMAEALAR